MSTTTKTASRTEPVVYVVWHKPPGARRWLKVGCRPTHAGAVALIDAGGDWHLAPLSNAGLAGCHPRPEQAGLFD